MDVFTRWSPDAVFVAADLVAYNGDLYEALDTSTGVAPPGDGTKWRRWRRSTAAGTPGAILPVFGTPSASKIPKWNASTQRLEWADDDGGSGASAPGLGSIVLADNTTTFYGQPFAPAWDGPWRDFPDPNPATGGLLQQGTVYSTVPFVWPAAVRITSVAIIPEGTADDGLGSAVDEDIRVALIPVDKHGHPAGAPVIEEIITVLSTYTPKALVENVIDVTVPAGRYAWYIEEAFTTADPAAGINLVSQPTAYPGSSLCALDGAAEGEMIILLTAPHVYGSLASAPAPAATVVGNVFTNAASTTVNGKPGLNMPQYPVFCEWEAAS